MKNKAFTLVELLAVITLIGLIALVTVVAVTKSLGKSKSAIAKAQEEQIENAARLWMADHQMLKPNVSNSDVVCNYAEINSCPKDYKTLVITLDTLQSEGYLDKGIKNLNNGNKLSGTTEIEITLNGKKIEYKINKVEIPKFKGTYVKAQSSDTHKGIVYMDPTDLSKKCTESNSVSTTGTKTGCMKFYIFDNSGSNYKMILDHNTTGTIKYNTTTPYVPYEQASIKTRVESDTAGWVGNPRLITAYEVANATNTTTFDSSNWDTHFYFDGTGTYKNTPTSHSKGENPYKWLFDFTYNCTSYGCNTDNSTTYGYWTSTPCSSGAWHVANNGGVGVFDVNNTTMGIRPVIELDKDIISGDDTPAKTYTEYNPGQEVLFDPVANAKCTIPVSTTGTKTGCMKWYIISTDDSSSKSTVDVILDHNTTATVAYETSGTYKAYEQATIKTTVDSDTSGWKSSLNPRLITANEVATITGNDGWVSTTATSSQYFYFGSNNTTSYSSQTAEQKARQASYHWLFDYTKGCTSYGCDTADSSTNGYWTSSSVSDISYNAWFVYRDGHLDYDLDVASANDYGIRPVITISKSKLK